jgi:hypothetical protein
LTAEYGRDTSAVSPPFSDRGAPIRVTYVRSHDQLLLARSRARISPPPTVTPERLQIVDFAPLMRTNVQEIVVTGPARPISPA